ncbi:MAG: YbaN family protein [Oscillospiraceae bacterium]
MKIKKYVYIIIGCVGLGLGALGAALPLLPAFPFLLLAAVCFGKSSERLHKWFVGTKLYKNNLESYVKGRGMTWKTKIRIMVIVTVTMSVGFIMMNAVPVGRIVLIGVWVFHILYFVFKVKTIKPEQSMTSEDSASE